MYIYIYILYKYIYIYIIYIVYDCHNRHFGRTCWTCIKE